MVKSHQPPERVFIVTNIISPDGSKKSFQELPSSDVPPQIPPRMKKKGPPPPEKPFHMRAKPIPTTSSQRDPLRPRNGHFDREREVLVAASRGGGQPRPIEKRQREPAKLLMPTSGGHHKKEMTILDDRLCLPSKKESVHIRAPETTLMRKSRPPILLIPRGMLPPTWGSTSAPASYGLWIQREAPQAHGGARREVVVKSRPERSSSVTRSGSLTSQGSSSSLDSGNETFPKSVLKKQKRNTNNNAKGNTTKKIEQKKNVTFNAFATVQLMDQ